MPEPETAAPAAPAANEIITPIQAARRYAKLIKKIHTQEAALKGTKDGLAAMAQILQEHFVDEGIQNLTVAGVTLILNRKLVGNVKAADREAFAAAIRRAGPTWNFLAKLAVNASQLGARIREYEDQTKHKDENGLPILPKTLRPYISLFEVFSIGHKQTAPSKAATAAAKK